MSMTDRVLRHNKRLLQESRYSPYTLGTKEKQKHKQKEEAVQLGVELSLFVAEAMFLLSDAYYVFETYIKPKNGVYKDGGKSSQWEQFKTFSYQFSFGVRVLARIVSILEIGGLVKPSGFKHYNQELKKLEEHLRSVKDVSEANGFAREAIESSIFHLWKSLFEATPEMIHPSKTKVLELF
ncbi:hypothetical protein (DUF1184) [Arabidopsis thaliana]|nr:hypothetical protein (DUF1184) [Arabidopsis thaliana]AEE31725.1 hypothetical protein (DUF1184) [Arabidopsis thaliana]|eukprot:NP_174716.1 hypothetical protein (DUF1184) [Arabidopsis thaliana]